MGNYWLRGIICFLAFVGLLQYAEGRRSMRKNFGFSELCAIGTEENTKEVRHFSKAFRRQQRYNKKIKINKQFQKYTKFAQKEFNLHTLNHPFARRMRSAKIGKVSLYKLPNENK